jgi:hypothetical protein
VTAIGVGDVNGDHKADVVVVDATSATLGFWVLLGKGDGTFGTPSSVSSTAVGNSVVVADFNGDCKADVLLPSLDNSTNMGSVELFLSNGDGTFQQSSSVDIAFDNSLSLVAGDFGGKGSLGFAITSVANPGIDVSVLGSTGMLSSPTLFHASDLSGLGPSSEVEGIAAGDLNGDGAADLVVATGSGPCVLMNGGSGQFSSAPVCYPASTGYTGDTVAIGDINGDRKADVVLGVGQSVTSGPSPIVVDIFSGKGDGTLGNPTTVQYTNGAFYDDVSLVDLNHDAMLDLIAYYGTGSSVEPSGFSVWMNSGTGTLPMMPTGQYGTPGGGPQAPAYGDFAGNGLMGMVAVNQVGTNFSINVISATCKP